MLPQGRLERTLDLHTGVLRQVLVNSDGRAEAALFSSLAHPGTVALRLEGPDRLVPAEAARPTMLVVEGMKGGVADRVNAWAPNRHTAGAAPPVPSSSPGGWGFGMGQGQHARAAGLTRLR